MTHSYQEFESRAPSERGSGRAAMRVWSIARTELTPVNRSRSRAAPRAASRASAWACGAQMARRAYRSGRLTSVNNGLAATENRRPGRCRGRCSARPSLVETRSWKSVYFRGTAARSATKRENFGDVPIGLSHGGRRSRSDPDFARPRRRCADPRSAAMAVRSTRPSSPVASPAGTPSVDGNAPGPRRRSRSCAVDDRRGDRCAGSACGPDRRRRLEVERELVDHAQPIPMGNAGSQDRRPTGYPAGSRRGVTPGGTVTPSRRRGAGHAARIHRRAREPVSCGYLHE